MGHGTKVGSGEADVVTRKNLIVRLQAPRFFVQKDEVVLSANVHNYLEKEKRCHRGARSRRHDASSRDRTDHGESRKSRRAARSGVDWRVKVLDEGEAVVRMKALTDEESDAMEMKLPGLRAWHAQDGIVGRRDPARQGQRRRSRSPCPKSGASSNRGSKCATRRRWPARWSMPCRTWPTIPTAAPSRRSTASCRP